MATPNFICDFLLGGGTVCCLVLVFFVFCLFVCFFMKGAFRENNNNNNNNNNNKGFKKMHLFFPGTFFFKAVDVLKSTTPLKDMCCFFGHQIHPFFFGNQNQGDLNTEETCILKMFFAVRNCRRKFWKPGDKIREN